ncbi:hypothetical protein M3J09_000556 [Ascochyta lentis]
MDQGQSVTILVFVPTAARLSVTAVTEFLQCRLFPSEIVL